MGFLLLAVGGICFAVVLVEQLLNRGIVMANTPTWSAQLGCIGIAFVFFGSAIVIFQSLAH